MIPSPKKTNLAMSALYAAPGMCDNLHSMKPAVLVTKRIFPEAIAYLKEHAELDYAESDDGMSAGELAARIRGKQAVVSQLMDKFSPEVLASLDGIKVIANVAVGYDNIDVPAATRLGIMVTHTPDVLTDTTADFAFTLLMAAARRVVEGHHFVHSGQWTKWRVDLLVGQDIHHRTLGIFGMGRIGQAVARRAKGFSMRIVFHDLRRGAGGGGEKTGGGAGGGRPRPRGAALVARLESVVLTPHIASASVDTRRKMSMMAAENAVEDNGRVGGFGD